MRGHTRTHPGYPSSGTGCSDYSPLRRPDTPGAPLSLAWFGWVRASLDLEWVWAADPVANHEEGLVAPRHLLLPQPLPRVEGKRRLHQLPRLSSAKTPSTRRINGFRMGRVTTLYAATAIRSPLRSLLLQPAMCGAARQEPVLIRRGSRQGIHIRFVHPQLDLPVPV